MKNTHLEHPEDSILTGNLSVLDWFSTNAHLSVKMDAPWIGFDSFAVCTSAVLSLCAGHRGFFLFVATCFYVCQEHKVTPRGLC